MPGGGFLCEMRREGDGSHGDLRLSVSELCRGILVMKRTGAKQLVLLKRLSTPTASADMSGYPRPEWLRVRERFEVSGCQRTQRIYRVRNTCNQYCGDTQRRVHLG
jgi:hypothetical protein